MGLSKSKTKTVQKNDPWAPAQPYILKNLAQQDAVFESTQPQLEKFAGMQRDTYGKLAPGAEEGIMAAQGLVNKTINGDFLQGNPYLDAILGQTRQNVIGGVNDQFSSSGRFGSGMHGAILAKELADAENRARYQNYSTERAYQNDAIGQAQSLMGGSQALLNNAAELPWIGVQAANGAVRQASNGYGTSTSKSTSSPALGPILAQMAASAAQAYAASDRRLKADIKLIRRLKDGLGVFSWTYRWGEKSQGVMADEVERLRPWALGPTVGGYATVNYGAL